MDIYFLFTFIIIKNNSLSEVINKDNMHLLQSNYEPSDFFFFDSLSIVINLLFIFIEEYAKPQSFLFQKQKQYKKTAWPTSHEGDIIRRVKDNLIGK